ncbi:MAG: hypothetical protein IKE73_01765 [Bacilli bacterium]|nr:hypothetical protein [Bacilli bacterium]
MKKREKHITRLHIILFFLVLIIFLSVFFGIRSKAKGKTEKYKAYESNMIKGARNYVKYKNISLEEGEETKISLSDLQKSNFVYDIPSECKGYVLVIYEENIESETLEMEYSAYLKCGKKYTSVNYSEY